uniref:Phage-related addiction module killer protein n=1 Tax=Bartonella schoenbuchensis TaxID=165694 RepID=A0A024LQM4_9HYPH|nr:phage-related addiction module killer protein [Bartonella schoenbuchensis]
MLCVHYSTHIMRIHKTEEFDTWLKKLKDKSVKAIILERITRLNRGLLGDVKFFNGIGVNYVSIMEPVTGFISSKAVLNLSFCYVVEINQHSKKILKKR